MICNKTTGAGFRGLLQYLLRGGRGEVVAGSMAGRSARELAQEFGRLRRLNPRLRKAVMHFSISPAPGDPPMGEVQWEWISQRFIGALGYVNAPWVAVIHRDTDHVHMHLAASRIDLDGRTISNFNDYRKAEQVMRELESELGLQVVLGPHSPVPTDRPGLPARAKRSKAKPRRKVRPDINPHGDISMSKHTALNPFQPGDPQFETWPQPFEPGTDGAVQAFAAVHTEVVQNCASSQLTVSGKEDRAMRRRIVERDYEQRMRQILGDDLTKVYKHAQGATLYFRVKGQIRDTGTKIVATGGMDEKLAAQRVVALGRERGWETITFTGTFGFLEHAMRTALTAQLVVITQDDVQSAILAKIMAERQGAMGSAVGPVDTMHPPPEPTLAILSELDHIPSQNWPKPAPTPTPVEIPAESPQVSPTAPPIPTKQPVVGVLPVFLNLRERLQHRRQLNVRTKPAPTRPAAPKKPGVP